MAQVKRTKVEQWGGLEVSRLGFGCMRLPVNEDRKIDRTKAAAMVDKAIESGINYFDSAYLYHGGESELFLGEVMKQYPRESFYLATKLPPGMVSAEDGFANIFEEQLRKLQTEYIDFYLLHGLGPARMEIVHQYKLIDKLIQAKKEGRIRHMGFSYHGDFNTLNELIDMGVWDFAQLQINYLDNEMIRAKALYEKLVAANVPCITMEPVRGGYLANPPEGVKALMAGFEGGKVSPAGWALRWCIHRSNMAVILSGMSTMEQMEENIQTFAEADGLTPAQEAMILEAAQIVSETRSIPCTACRYCMECPSGVEIPDVFGIYNRYELFKNGFRTGEDYKVLVHNKKDASLCTRCGECSPKCPQEIEIPDRLQEVRELVDKLAAAPPRRR